MNTRRIFSRGLGTGLVAAVLVSACDFEVTNPGPVQDGNLAFVASHQGMINGAIRATQDGFGTYQLLGGALTHDLMASGHTGSAGVRPQEEVGLLSDDYDGRGAWGDLHNGRWIAEEALRRFAANEEVDVGTYDLAAQAHFWAGIASRTLGENACTAIFDGGGPQDKMEYFSDPAHGAIYHFTEAERIARASGQDHLATASVGARAAAHLFMGNGSLAQADAATIALDYEFSTIYTGFGGEYWYLPGHVQSLGFQSMSLWGTPMHPHFLDTGDSRVAWGYDNGTLEIPSGLTAAVRGQTHPARPTWVALIPMFYTLKALAPRSITPDENGIIRELRIFEPIRADQRKLQFNLVDGREMALIQAEAMLMQGNMAGAMGMINDVRTSTPVYAADLSSAMDLALHVDEAGQGLPDYYALHGTGTPGNFSAGGFMAALTATTMDEAWAALKFERLLEFNIEGRRMGDRWRWRTNGTPGALHPLEFIPSELTARYGVPADPLNLCFPLPRRENDSNANIPEDFQDWVVG